MKSYKYLSVCLLSILFHIVSTAAAPDDKNNNGSTINTVPPSNSTTSTPSKPPTTTAIPRNCSAFASCGDCTKDYHCFWCAASSICHEYPKGKIVPKGCKKNNWFWKQCFIPGYVLIIIVPVLSGLLLLCCGCCIYCKCCRSKSLHWKKQEEQITQKRKDRQQKADDKKSKRKERTDALRMKYGLLKENEDDEDPLI